MLETKKLQEKAYSTLNVLSTAGVITPILTLEATISQSCCMDVHGLDGEQEVALV